MVQPGERALGKQAANDFYSVTLLPSYQDARMYAVKEPRCVAHIFTLASLA